MVVRGGQNGKPQLPDRRETSKTPACKRDSLPNLATHPTRRAERENIVSPTQTLMIRIASIVERHGYKPTALVGDFDAHVEWEVPYNWLHADGTVTYGVDTVSARTVREAYQELGY
jgi:hypothetical protein